MGNKNTKGTVNFRQSTSDDIGHYSCRITKNQDNSVQINPYQVITQFGSRYVYFNIPKEILKDNFSNISIFYQNFSITPNLTDSCLIVNKKSSPIKIIIDNIEYLEYSQITDKGGKFSIRENKKNINKSMLVYNNSIDKC